jgi:hypothetical protein
VQEPLPPTTSFQCFSLGFLSRSHISTNKNRTKESKLQSLQLLPTTCILVGQGRVVVLVGIINAPYLILFLKKQNQKWKRPFSARKIIHIGKGVNSNGSTLHCESILLFRFLECGLLQWTSLPL